jgi:hypothetical protein
MYSPFLTLITWCSETGADFITERSGGNRADQSLMDDVSL